MSNESNYQTYVITTMNYTPPFYVEAGVTAYNMAVTWAWGGVVAGIPATYSFGTLVGYQFVMVADPYPNLVIQGPNDAQHYAFAVWPSTFAISGLWNATGKEYGYLSYQLVNTWGNSQTSLQPVPIGVVVGINNRSTDSMTFSWLRLRAYLPNGVTPSVSIGKVI
jgi:hypothetical protein